MAYKVTEKDLLGNLIGFPIPIVEKLLYYQVQQGNKEDVRIFQAIKGPRKKEGGFDWSETDISLDKSSNIRFWLAIIKYKNFGVFFNRFPSLKSNYIKETKRLESLSQEEEAKIYNPFKDATKEEVILEEEDNVFIEESTIKLPKLGEVILVSDTDTIGTTKRVFIQYVPNTKYPVLTVTLESWEKLLSGDNNRVRIYPYKNFAFIPKEEFVYLTLEDISAGKGVGIDPKLIKIKK